jgi:hypothetical protein
MATSATIGVSRYFGALLTPARMAVPNRPERSATPAPSITTST